MIAPASRVGQPPPPAAPPAREPDRIATPAAPPGRPPLLLALTRDGRVRDPGALDRLAQRARNATDCFVFCPGWLHDEDQSRHEAGRFFALLDAALLGAGDRVAPLRLALHWPSVPFAGGDGAAPATGGLWPALERQVAAGPLGLSFDAGRLLFDLCAAEVPGFDEPGVYHPLLDGRVRGSVVALRAGHDRARSPHRESAGGRVGPHTAEVIARSALGAAGARGVGAPEVDLVEAQAIGLPRRPIVNVDGSRVVRASAPGLGAHLDIHHQEIATLVLLAAGVLEVGPDGLRTPRVARLGRG